MTEPTETPPPESPRKPIPGGASAGANTPPSKPPVAPVKAPAESPPKLSTPTANTAASSRPTPAAATPMASGGKPPAGAAGKLDVSAAMPAKAAEPGSRPIIPATVAGGSANARANATPTPTDPPPPVPPRVQAGPTSVAATPPPPSGRGALGIISALGFVLLCGGLYYVYQRETALASAIAENDPSRVATLEGQLRSVGQRLDAVEKRPAPAPSAAGSPAADGVPAAALQPLQSRLDALEKRLQALNAQPNPPSATAQANPPPTPVPAPDLTPLTGRLDAVEQRVQALASQPPPAQPDVGAAVAPLAAQLSTLASREQSATTAANDRLAGLEKRIADAEQRASGAEQRATAADQRAGQAEQRATAADQRAGQITTQAAQVAAEATRASRVQLAGDMLAAGQPLGDIPGAPPALVRFSRERPPTEADLRLSFPAAADAAAEASRPSTDGQSLGQRMWGRARALVTVREGNKVVLGAPAMTTLAAARERLDAGDLAGCVAAINRLDGPAAQAIADWRDRAQALLDARSAIATMAHG